jgi:hypothetical protein
MTPFTDSGVVGFMLSRLGRWPGHERALTVAGGLLLASVVLAIGMTMWDLRRIAIAEVMSNTDNLSIVLADQTSHSVRAVDIVLHDIHEQVAALGITTPEQFRDLLSTREIHDFPRNQRDRLRQVDNLALIGADGF